MFFQPPQLRSKNNIPEEHLLHKPLYQENCIKYEYSKDDGIEYWATRDLDFGIDQVIRVKGEKIEQGT